MSKVKGVKNAMKQFNDELVALKGRVTVAGLMAGGLIVEGEAKRRVPREYGNLVGSGYTRKHPSKPNSVQVGFSAAYALHVHENLEQTLKGKPRKSGLGVYWGPAGEPKYLTNAAAAKRAEVVAAVKKYARKK